MTARLSSLEVPAACTVRRFERCFPDANQYMSRWARHLQVGTVRKLAAKLGYKGPTQLLTMYACLLMDGRLRSHGWAAFRCPAVIRSIRKHRREMRNIAGHEAHPANICQAAVDSLAS